MYLLLELVPSIRRLYFGENVHVEVLYSEVHDHIWSVIAYLSDDEWKNLPLALVGIELGDVYCFELVRDSDSSTTFLQSACNKLHICFLERKSKL